MAEQKGGKDAGGGDPSMEDILASIRRILAEDQSQAAEATPAAAAPPTAPQPAVVTAPEEVDDVLDLTEDMLAQEPRMALPPEPEPAPAPAPAPAPQPLLKVRDPFDELEASMPDMPPVRLSNGDGGLLGSAAVAAATAAFSRLSEGSGRESLQAAVPVHRSGGPSLEDLVRDELRPLLADWLNQNLPEIVERVVRDEVRRVAGHR